MKRINPNSTRKEIAIYKAYLQEVKKVWEFLDNEYSKTLFKDDEDSHIRKKAIEALIDEFDAFLDSQR